MKEERAENVQNKEYWESMTTGDRREAKILTEN